MKRIGILGSGVVARALGAGFIRHGYPVMLGTRDPGKLTEWVAEQGPSALVGSFEEAASFGDIVVLAVRGSGAMSAIELAGPANLKNKTVIDTTNPISPKGAEEGVLHFSTSLERSLMEDLQECCPDIRFVKAFNSVGNKHMVDPQFSETPTMFICGNNAEAKSEVSGILREFGWQPEDFGSAVSARAIEPLCILWCIPGFQRGDWDHALRWVH